MEPYDQISELSADEAQDVLQDFLQLERENFPRFKFGEVELDFSPASVI